MPQITPLMLKAVAAGAALVHGHQGVISVEVPSANPRLIVIRVAPAALSSFGFVPKQITVSRMRFETQVIAGPTIISALGNLATDKPYQTSTETLSVGGDLIATTRLPGWYGTLGGTFRQISYDVQGLKHWSCTVNNAIFSNNHV